MVPGRFLYINTLLWWAHQIACPWRPIICWWLPNLHLQLRLLELQNLTETSAVNLFIPFGKGQKLWPLLTPVILSYFVFNSSANLTIRIFSKMKGRGQLFHLCRGSSILIIRNTANLSKYLKSWEHLLLLRMQLKNVMYQNQTKIITQL